MGTLAHFADNYIADVDGDGELEPVSGALVDVFQQGTETVITETIYATDSAAGATLTNPLTTGTDGKIEFYLASPKRVDLRFRKTGLDNITRTVDCDRNGLNLRGAWSSVTQYQANDAVTYNGETWGALQANTNVTPVEGVNWTKLAAAGDVSLDPDWDTDHSGGATSILNLRARGAANSKALFRVMPQGTFTGDKAEFTIMGNDIDEANRWWADLKVAEESGTLRRLHLLTDREGTAEPITRVVFEIDGEAESTVLEQFAIVRNGWIANTEAGTGSGVWMLRIEGGTGITRIEQGSILLSTGNFTLGTTTGDVVIQDEIMRPFADANTDLGHANFQFKDLYLSGNVKVGGTNKFFPSFARKTANESVTSSTTLQDDDHLSLAVGASEIWIVELQLFFPDPGATTTRGLKIGFSGPAAASFLWAEATEGAASALTSFVEQRALADTVNIGTSTSASIKGIYVGGGTAGTLQFRWAQVVSDAVATTVSTNSYLKAERVS